MNRFLAVLANTILLLFSIAGATSGQELESGYFIGRLNDGRMVTLSLNFQKTNALATLHLSGTPVFFEMTGGITNHAPLLLKPIFDSDEETLVALMGNLNGHPAVFRGALLNTNGGKAFELTATNVARQQTLHRHRGLKLGDHGGNAVYDAYYPEFPKTNLFGSAVTASLTTNAESEGREFVSSGWGNAWQGFKYHSFRNEWESACKAKISLASERLISVFVVHYEYTGGAHPNTTLQGRNFVFTNGQAREFKLDELFRRNSG